MFLREIIEVLENHYLSNFYKNEKLSPSLQYGTFYPEKHIKKVLLTSYPSLACIHYAIKNKFNLIISYYKLIEENIYKIQIPLLEKLSLLSRGSIHIYILDKSFFFSSIGISNTLNKHIYFKKKERIEFTKKSDNYVLGDISFPQDIIDNSETLPNLKELLSRIKINFNIEILPYVGKLEERIKKVCILPNTNDDIENHHFIEGLESHDIRCYLVSNISQKNAFFAHESNINLIKYPIFKLVSFCMESLTNNLSLEFPYDEFKFFNFTSPMTYY